MKFCSPGNEQIPSEPLTSAVTQPQENTFTLLNSAFQVVYDPPDEVTTRSHHVDVMYLTSTLIRPPNP